MAVIHILFTSLVFHWFCIALQVAPHTDFVLELGGSLQIALIAVAYRSVLAFFTTTVWGSLSDQYGRKTVMLSSALGGAIAYATLASSTSIEMLFVAKTINGLMMGLPPAVQAYIIDITPQDRISSRLGLSGAMIGIGFLLGVPVGGILATNYGNRAPFYCAALVCCLNSVLIFFLEESTRKKSDAKKKGITETFMDIVIVWKRPTLTGLLNTRLLQEIGMGISNNAIAEYSRSVLNLSAQSRGFMGMILGLEVTVVQIFVSSIAALLGGTEKAISISLLSTALFTFSVPFASADVTQFLGAASMLTICSAPLLPLLNSMLSKNAPPQVQGAVIGASESTISFGSIIGPLCTAFLIPIGVSVPYYLGGAVLLLGYFAFRSRRTEQRVS